MKDVFWAAICAGLLLSNWLLWKAYQELKNIMFVHFDFHLWQDPEWGKKVEKFIEIRLKEEE